jgi:quinol monooxygenase YgiN
MTMIVLNVRIEASPATVAALKDALVTMEAASRAEPGCIDYVFASEIGDPGNIRIIEHWQDIDALKRHFTLPHMSAFNEAVRSNPPKSIDVKMFDASPLPFPPR